MFANLHGILAQVGGVHIENCKSRALAHDTFYIGDGDAQRAFVHLEVLLVEGRSPRWIEHVGTELLECLEQAFAASKRDFDLQITVNFVDLVRQRYFKYPAGTLTPLDELELK